jgi:hypothetical protein
MRHYNKPDDVTIWHYVLRIGLICIVMFFSVYLFLLQWGFLVEWLDDVRHQYRAVLLLAVLAGAYGLVFLWNKIRRI